MQVAASEQMHMQMKDRLAGTGANVEHCAVAVLDGLLARDFGGCQVTAANQFRVFGCSFLESVDMFFGNDEHMRRSLWVDIFEGESVFVFIDFLGRYFSADDTAEQTIIHDTSQF
jgi:hypothetical protein